MIKARFTGRAFGLALEGTFPIPDVLERSNGSECVRPERRHVELTVSDPEPASRRWPSEGTQRTFQMARPDEAPFFTIDHHPDAGYRVWIDGLGQCIIGADGKQIVCVPPVVRNALRWELLLSQGLPISAALLGLEVLHASAVVFEDRAMAFTAPSGTGKTSLALNLLAHGAEFLADDVTAIEVEDDALLVNPGLRVANVHRREQSALRAAGIAPPRLEPEVKHRVAIPLRKEPAALGAFYFLNRASGIARPRITRLNPPDPRLLLAATFVAHLPLASRLINQLEVCSRLARMVPVFRVEMPVEGTAVEVADHVARHAKRVS